MKRGKEGSVRGNLYEDTLTLSLSQGLQPLSVHSVFLLGEGTNESTTVAAKTSSSDLRKQLLGSLRKPKVIIFWVQNNYTLFLCLLDKSLSH